MPPVLEWFGDAASVIALEACLSHSAERPALRLSPHSPLLPDFVLQDQAAALGLATSEGPATAAPTPRPDAHAELVARGYRGVLVEARAPLDAAFLGRVLDAQALRDAERMGGAGAFEVFVFDGPRFRRRVDLVTFDAEPVDDAWRLPLGLRGC